LLNRSFQSTRKNLGGQFVHLGGGSTANQSSALPDTASADNQVNHSDDIALLTHHDGVPDHVDEPRIVFARATDDAAIEPWGSRPVEFSHSVSIA
jgi:hypothetical protein